jgi:hypothetical protein
LLVIRMGPNHVVWCACHVAALAFFGLTLWRRLASMSKLFAYSLADDDVNAVAFALVEIPHIS